MKQEDKKPNQKKLNKEELKEELKEFYENGDKELTEDDIEKLDSLMKVLGEGQGKLRFFNIIKTILTLLVVSFISSFISYFVLKDSFISCTKNNIIFIVVYAIYYALTRFLIHGLIKDMYYSEALKLGAVGLGIVVTIVLSNKHIFIQFEGIGVLVGFFILHFVINIIINTIIARYRLKKLLKL